MIFRNNPAKTAQKTRASRDDLAARLANAEAAIVELKMDAERLALDAADDATLYKAEAKTRAAVDHSATLKAALAQREAEIADLDREIAELADRKMRSESAATLEKLAVEFETISKVFDAAAAKMSDVATRAAVLVFEAKGLETFFGSVRVEIPVAVDGAAASLRSLARQIESGGAPAALPKPEQPVARAPVAAPAAVTRLFAMRAIKWVEADGAQRLSGKYRDVDLPAGEIAARALKSGACVALSDPRRRSLNGTSPGHPDESWCFNLSDDAVVAETTIDRAEPELHSAFTRVDRGPGFVVKTARGVA